MTPTNEAFEALMPKVAFCRVGDVLGSCAPMCGLTENAKLYTAGQMRQMFDAATERAATSRPTFPSPDGWQRRIKLMIRQYGKYLISQREWDAGQLLESIDAAVDEAHAVLKKAPE